ncbi:MAG: HugZ family protein [Rhizobiaceae bacterium]
MAPADRKKEILQPVDNEAIALARNLLRTARYGALATLDPETASPVASRVATATDVDGAPLILVSALAPHTASMIADTRCSLMVGEPGKGDPLAHPRMTLHCHARKLDRDHVTGRHARRRYLNRHSKASLYADFADFSFFRLEVISASLNGGFARAYVLGSDQLLLNHAAIAQFAEAEQSVLDHMNTDHADAVGRLAERAGEATHKKWKLTGVDPEGFDLAHGDSTRRGVFPDMLEAPEDFRDAFITLSRSAKNA